MKRTVVSIFITLIITLSLTDCNDLTIYGRIKELADSTPTPTKEGIDDPTSESTALPTPVATETPTPVPTETPTPVPTEVPAPTPNSQDPGSVWFYPLFQTVRAAGDTFTTELHLNSGTQDLKYFEIGVEFASNVIKINKEIGTNGVTAAKGYIVNEDDVYLTTDGIAIKGVYEGFSPPSGDDIHFITINWIANSSGNSPLHMNIGRMLDSKNGPIPKTGDPIKNDGGVTVR